MSVTNNNKTKNKAKCQCSVMNKHCSEKTVKKTHTKKQTN